VTGTVESPYLISASIMSKKLAEGIDALVLDVKTGSGAFMKREEDALQLARLMVETGTLMGKKMAALITDMDQPLGLAVGNALEVAECVEVMRGAGPDDLRELSAVLCAWMFCLGGRTPTVEAGKRLALELIDNGAALAKFEQIVRLQKGDPRVVADPARLPQAAHRREIRSASTGRIARIECAQVGIASLLLGGGREKKEDGIDPAVGLVLHKKTGDAVAAGEPLCTVHYNSAVRLEEVCLMLQKAFRMGDVAPGGPRPLVLRVLEGYKAEGAAPAH